jgi:hypothetical protein
MVEMQVEVPDFQTVEEAEAFLIRITSLVGSGDLSLPTGLDLATLVRTWISAKHAAMELEIKRINASQDVGSQTIHITGGLPQLPGNENLIMPELNGHSLELSAIPAVPNQGSGDGSPAHSEEKK